MCSSARNDQRQLECMDQVLDITMCAGAIGGSLKFKKLHSLRTKLGTPPNLSGNLFFTILFRRAFPFAPH